MHDQKNLVLNAQQIHQKIMRMAFEIYEQHFGHEQVVLAGIDGMGYRLAALLAGQLREVSPLSPRLVRVCLDKLAPRQCEVRLEGLSEGLDGLGVVLVDDVFNTGRTLAYSLKPFLEAPIRRLQVAVLVDRGHHSFPIQPDFVGYALSTTINEHIEVALTEAQDLGGSAVWLY